MISLLKFSKFRIGAILITNGYCYEILDIKDDVAVRIKWIGIKSKSGFRKSPEQILSTAWDKSTVEKLKELPRSELDD